MFPSLVTFLPSFIIFNSLRGIPNRVYRQNSQCARVLHNALRKMVCTFWEGSLRLQRAVKNPCWRRGKGSISGSNTYTGLLRLFSGKMEPRKLVFARKNYAWNYKNMLHFRFPLSTVPHMFGSSWQTIWFYGNTVKGFWSLPQSTLSGCYKDILLVYKELGFRSRISLISMLYYKDHFPVMVGFTGYDCKWFELLR